jgi:hypothetical protein
MSPQYLAEGPQDSSGLMQPGHNAARLVENPVEKLWHEVSFVSAETFWLYLWPPPPR